MAEAITVITETIYPSNGETVDLTNKAIDGGGPGEPDPANYATDHPPGTLNFGVDLSGTKGVTILGGEIRNCTDAGIKVGSAQRPTIKGTILHHNCYAQSENGSGIDLGSGGSDITIDGIEAYQNGQDAINGSDVRGLILENSYLHDHYLSHPDGIQLWGPNYSENIIIRNNVFRDFLQAIFLGENTRANACVSNVKVFNNLIYKCRYGIVPYHSLNRDWVIRHNTVADIEQAAIHLWNMGDAGTQSFVVEDNIVLRADHCIFRSASVINNIYWHTRVSDWPAIGNRNIDPMLDENYCPVEGSPVIGAALDGLNIGLLCDTVTPEPPPEGYAFEYGFKDFASKYPSIVGGPMGPMVYGRGGNCWQATERGTLYYIEFPGLGNLIFFMEGEQTLWV